jgi:predicted alpha/beta-fold hydrolase
LIGHLQTVVASLLPPPRVALQRSRWETPDGDFVDVDFAGDAALPKLMVLFHGLEGSSDSHYARVPLGRHVGGGLDVAALRQTGRRHRHFARRQRAPEVARRA